MKVESTDFGGWPNCLRLANTHAEVVVTLDVGPRVISYHHLPGGKNVLKTNAEELGGKGEDHYVSRGGHRFWLAPEDERTCFPDNSAVQHTLVPHGVRLENPATAPWHIRKSLTVTLAEDSSQVKLEHRATNEGSAPTTLATWGVTVMEAGGLEIIPRPPSGEHPRDRKPDRLQVLWPYTNTADERWRWGRQFITLRQTPHSSPTKLGLMHRMKWIGYLTRSVLFIKLVEYSQDRRIRISAVILRPSAMRRCSRSRRSVHCAPWPRANRWDTPRRGASLVPSPSRSRSRRTRWPNGFSLSSPSLACPDCPL